MHRVDNRSKVSGEPAGEGTQVDYWGPLFWGT